MTRTDTYLSVCAIAAGAAAALLGGPLGAGVALAVIAAVAGVLGVLAAQGPVPTPPPPADDLDDDTPENHGAR